MESKNPIQVAERLFLVMETLADTGSVTLAALCSRLDLNKSTVHRLLSSLICAGYVKQNPHTGEYALSYKVLMLSDKVLAHMDIPDMVRPFLKELSARTGETVHFVQRDGTEAVYIFKEESDQNMIRMASRVGSRIPLYCSGVGKAMLADMQDDQIREIWENSDIQSKTGNTIVDYPAFLTEIQKVRACGFAEDNEENELGVHCIAVSIPDVRGQDGYAFSISAPATRMTPERIKELAEIILTTKVQITEEILPESEVMLC